MDYTSYVEKSGLFRVLIPAVSVFISCCVAFGVVTNVLLIVSILRQRPLRQSPTFLMLLSLAGSDVVVLSSVPLYIHFITTGGTCLPLCQMFLYFVFSSITSSTYHLVAFAVMRYVLLIKPLFATKNVTAKCTLVICCFLWILSFGVASTTFMFTGIATFNITTNSTVDVCMLDYSGGHFAPMAFLAVNAVLPLTFIYVFHIVKCYRVRAKVPQSATRSRRRQLSTKLIVGILVLFTLTSTPSVIVWNVVHFSTGPASLKLVVVAFIVTVMNYFNSVLNPLIYFFFSDKGRKSVCTCISETNDVYCEEMAERTAAEGQLATH